MLSPKLQTLNSFGFLRESKKSLNIPGTLLQEIIIKSRIENFQSTARTSGASTEYWTSNSKSTVHSKCISRQLAPLLQQRSQQHELYPSSSNVQHQKQSEPGEPFCLAFKITSLKREKCLTQLPRICGQHVFKELSTFQKSYLDHVLT